MVKPRIAKLVGFLNKIFFDIVFWYGAAGIVFHEKVTSSVAGATPVLRLSQSEWRAQQLIAIPIVSRTAPQSIVRNIDCGKTKPAASTVEEFPPAIGFLVDFDVDPGVLRDATERAKQDQCRPEAALLASGKIGADFYYRALASNLGLHFVAGEIELGPGARFPQSLSVGFAPLAVADDYGEGWLFAPAGNRLDQLLELKKRKILPRNRFAITTPENLRRLLFQQKGDEIAEAAAGILPAWRGDLSARSQATLLQKILVGLFFLLGLCALGLGDIYWLTLSLIAGSVLAGAIVVRIFAAAASVEPFRTPHLAQINEDDLPVYTIVVALYHEAGVVPALIDALDRLDYPRTKLDIKLVTECDDEETRTALAILDLPSHYQVITMPGGVPRTKPRALNVALPIARGELICIFDAEDIPDVQQLRDAAALFSSAEPDVGCLQARLAIDNSRDSWLTRMFALEYAALFDVINPGLAAMAMPIPLGGTSNHFRTGTLKLLRGWDAWNVTEDIDLGLRLARFGFRVLALNSTTAEEAPVTLGLWMRQRRRWFKGWMQTALVHLRRPRRVWSEMGFLPATVATLHVGGTLFGSMFGPAFAIVACADLLWGDLLYPQTRLGLIASTCWCFVFIAGAAAAFWPLLLGMKRRGLFALSGWLLTMPFYWLLLTLAAWWALLDLLRNPFHWHKTEHGLARTSRRPSI